MKTFFFLSTAAVIFHSQNAAADVDLLSGAFQFSIPGTSLEYSSRRAASTSTGFGWTGSLPPGANVKLSKGDLVRIDWNKQIWVFQYDSFHNLKQIKHSSGGLTDIKYDEEQDRVRALMIKNGCSETFKYQENDRALDLEARKLCPDTGAEIIKLKATYTGSRRRLEQVAWQKTDEHTAPSRVSKGSLVYDEQGRLVFHVTDDELLAYEYDADGFIAAVTRGKEQLRFEYDLQSRLHKIITDRNEQIHLKYDSSGRLQSLDENTLAVAAALRAALEKLSPIEGGLAL